MFILASTARSGHRRTCLNSRKPNPCGTRVFARWYKAAGGAREAIFLRDVVQGRWEDWPHCATTARRRVSVSRDSAHRFTKPSREAITLLKGLDIEGDAHLGTTVQHRSRVALDPAQPNLRQVHRIHSELFAEVGVAGFNLRPGDMGENVTTAGINLLALPQGSRLSIGDVAVVALLVHQATRVGAFPGC